MRDWRRGNASKKVFQVTPFKEGTLKIERIALEGVRHHISWVHGIVAGCAFRIVQGNEYRCC